MSGNGALFAEKGWGFAHEARKVTCQRVPLVGGIPLCNLEDVTKQLLGRIADDRPSRNHACSVAHKQTPPVHTSKQDV